MAAAAASPTRAPLRATATPCSAAQQAAPPNPQQVRSPRPLTPPPPARSRLRPPPCPAGKRRPPAPPAARTARSPHRPTGNAPPPARPRVGGCWKNPLPARLLRTGATTCAAALGGSLRGTPASHSPCTATGVAASNGITAGIRYQYWHPHPRHHRCRRLEWEAARDSHCLPVQRLSSPRAPGLLETTVGETK